MRFIVTTVTILLLVYIVHEAQQTATHVIEGTPVPSSAVPETPAPLPDSLTESSRSEQPPPVSATSQSTIPLTMTSASSQDDELRKATALCTKTSGTIQKNVIGISDPRLIHSYAREQVKEIGSNWVRAEFMWDLISPESGEYYLNDSDEMVKDFALNTIMISAQIGYIPAYITDWTTLITDYPKFLATLVSRYKPNGIFSMQAGLRNSGISYWEIFNEPNSPGYGWFGGRSGTLYKGEDLLPAYVYMLALSNVTIRAIDKNAVIIMGGLSPDGYPPFEFLKRVYELGAKDCFDVLAFHPYAYEGRFDVAASELRAIATANNDTGKIIWFNEYGTPDNVRRVSLLEKAAKQKNAADGFFWYTLVDYFDNADGSWGVVKLNGERKSEYGLLKELLR